MCRVKKWILFSAVLAAMQRSSPILYGTTKQSAGKPFLVGICLCHASWAASLRKQETNSSGAKNGASQQ